MSQDDAYYQNHRNALEVQTWQTGRLNHATDSSIFVLPYFEGMVILP